MVDLAQADHVIELMLLASWADGRAASADAHRQSPAISRLVARQPLLQGHGPIGEVSKVTQQRLAREGVEQCLLASVRGLKDKPYRELGFQCAAKMAHAGSRGAVADDRLLRRLQTMLGFQPADVERLLESPAEPR